MAPTVEALAEKLEGRVRVGKLNIDENQATPTKLGIRAIPTLLLFESGYVIEGCAHTNLMEQPKLSTEVVVEFLKGTGVATAGSARP